MNVLDDAELEPPTRPDFRRVGKGIPFVLNPEGKRVRYGRPSNIGKILDDDSGLTDWKLRTVVAGAAQRPDLMATVSTLDPKADKKSLRDIAEECLVAGKGQERAVKGSAIHAMFDRIDRQDDWEPAPQWIDLCEAYVNALDYWGLVAVDIECHVVNDEYHLAGTMDRRYRTTKVLVAPDGCTIPIGSMIGADTKTGATLEYAPGGYATQLAAYVDSIRYDVGTDEREPFQPPTYQDWGLIVHADSGGHEVNLYWVDLNAGRQGLKLAREVKGWRQRADLLTLGAAPVMLSSVSSPQAAPVVPQDGSRAAGLLDHTRGRVRAVLAHSDLAGKQLAREWPTGVPGLKQGGHTWDQLQAVIAAVERVEFSHSVPFYPPWDDPDEMASRERHPSTWETELPEPEPTLTNMIDMHPKKELVKLWAAAAIAGGVDHTIDHGSLTAALLEFASIENCTDNELTIFLDGTIRAMGYVGGIMDLGHVREDQTPMILGAAFSIMVGTAVLVYGEDDQPVLRNNVVRG
jgi:hypothetical protein